MFTLRLLLIGSFLMYAVPALSAELTANQQQELAHLEEILKLPSLKRSYKRYLNASEQDSFAQRQLFLRQRKVRQGIVVTVFGSVTFLTSATLFTLMMIELSSGEEDADLAGIYFGIPSAINMAVAAILLPIGIPMIVRNKRRVQTLKGYIKEDRSKILTFGPTLFTGENRSTFGAAAYLVF